MKAEEELAELESRANSLASEYGKRGGVTKANRVDAPHSRFISAGGFHSAAIDDEGLLWTWGRNAEGQLGLGDAAFETQRDVIEPKNVSLDFFNGKHVRHVECGIRVSAAIDQDGSLWTWGEGKAYLGHEDIHLPELGGSYDVAVPRRMNWPISIDSNIRVASVSLGWSHTVILDDKGDVYTWGYGGNGRLGHGDETSRVAPSRVHDIPPHEIAAVAAGGAFTVARSKSGLAIAWGAGHCTGQGEFGSHDDVLTPEIIPKTKTMDVTAVAAGGLHAALLTRDGGCYTWGWGECGQLGLGRRVAEVVRDPTQVDTESQRITMVACGAYHTAIVEEGGELMTFGAGGKRWVAETTEDDHFWGEVSSSTSRPGSQQGSKAGSSIAGSQNRPGSKGSTRPGSKASTRPGSRGSARFSQAGDDDPGNKRDKQGFTKAEREAFNLQLAAKAMNIKTMTDLGNNKIKTQEGYQDYVIRRRQKIPDGTQQFKDHLKELEKEETRVKRRREALRREGETEEELKAREEAEREAEWDRRMEMWWNGIMVWVNYSIDIMNPMPLFRRYMRCCLKAKADKVDMFQGRSVVRTKDVTGGMEMLRELDGKNGEMCRLGFAGLEELREDGAGDRVKPRVVTGPWRLKAGSRVVGVSCGPYHTLAVCENGEVFAFGVGLNGRLGLGDTEAVGAPAHIMALSKAGISVGHPGRRMGLSKHITDDPFADDSKKKITQAELDAIALIKLSRAGGGGLAQDGRLTSLPNRRRVATLEGKPDWRAYTPSTVPSRDGTESPPPELNDDEIEAFTGRKKKNKNNVNDRGGGGPGSRRTVIDDILGPPTLGLPKV